MSEQRKPYDHRAAVDRADIAACNAYYSDRFARILHPERMTLEQLDAACAKFAALGQKPPYVLMIHPSTIPTDCLGAAQRGDPFTTPAGHVVRFEVKQ